MLATIGAACHRALDKQLSRGKRPDDRRRNPWVVRRTGECIQSVYMLAFDPKRFATRCQNVNLRCSVDYAGSQRCHRFDEMLARIKDQ
jgi:hypothetical protein